MSFHTEMVVERIAFHAADQLPVIRAMGTLMMPSTLATSALIRSETMLPTVLETPSITCHAEETTLTIPLMIGVTADATLETTDWTSVHTAFQWTASSRAPATTNPIGPRRAASAIAMMLTCDRTKFTASLKTRLMVFHTVVQCVT